MIDETASIKRAIRFVSAGARFTALLVLCLIAKGCQTVPVLEEAALYGCGTGKVYLSGWWVDTPDKSAISYDPIGGYVFAYWVDDDGNVCHGNPGVNAQTGPAVINVFKTQAYASAVNQSVITEAQLRDFQEVPVSFDHYSGSGLHFVQFANKLTRSRADGKTDKWDSTFSVPVAMDVGAKSCIAPKAFQLNELLLLPSNPNATAGQDPVRCKVKAKPDGTSMNEESLKKYHVLDLKHGNEIYTLP